MVKHDPLEMHNGSCSENLCSYIKCMMYYLTYFFSRWRFQRIWLGNLRAGSIRSC